MHDFRVVVGAVLAISFVSAVGACAARRSCENCAASGSTSTSPIAAGSGGSVATPAVPASAGAGAGGAGPTQSERAGAGGLANGVAGVRAAAGTAAQPACAAASCAPDAGPATAGASAGTSGGAGGSAGGSAGSSMADDAGVKRMPDPKFLVPATGPCPEFHDGYVTFMPDGVARSVLLYMSDAAKSMDGPLIFSWHSTLPGPEMAELWLGTSEIAEIEAQGGIVAAPSARDPSTTRPWDNTALGPSGDNDERLMDEIVACANQKVGIDLRRIHAIGMSAGGLKSAQVSLRRSGYIASVVVYSGGLMPNEDPPDQDPDSKFAAMIFYGGATDISPVDATPYTAASTKYRDLLRSKGRFAFMCNHGGGHSVPSDSQPSAWQFLQDHPFGTSPSPYASGLPAGFPRYCSLQ